MYIPIVIPMEDPIIHDAFHPFCDDLSCPCYQDEQLLDDLRQDWENGFYTLAECQDLWAGMSR